MRDYSRSPCYNYRIRAYFVFNNHAFFTIPVRYRKLFHNLVKLNFMKIAFFLFPVARVRPVGVSEASNVLGIESYPRAKSMKQINHF